MPPPEASAHDAPDTGTVNWQLARTLPLRILEAAANRLRSSRAWKRKLDRWGVVAVASGMRRRGSDQDSTDEPCLILRVQKRWSKARAKKAAEDRVIPKTLMVTRLAVDGPPRTFTIPVDVQEVPSAIAGATEERRVVAGRQATATSPMTAQILGAVCARVRSGGSNTVHALSCVHVLGSMLWSPRDPFFVPDAAIALRDGNALLHLTPRDAVQPARFWKSASPRPRGYDAALADLDEASAQRLGTTYFPKHPRRHAETLAELLSHRECLVRLPGSRDPVHARYLSSEETYPLRSITGHIYDAKNVMLFEVTSSHGTQVGDSGSMVVSASAELLLLGMHLGGLPNGREIVVARADVLFKPGVAFSDGLSLAPP